ncbi:hypothetical protein CN404_31680, partial [Bacillus thuringiensis]|uniref:BclA C-terminal domain-containing protein n=1 Tax=Bacillus thuringiensis TaxID=1428 RepID=UPI000BFB10ED
ITGPTGLAALSYGYIYHIVPSTNNSLQQISTGSPIPWSDNAILAGGISHAAGSPTITVPNNGVYQIAFTVQTENSAQLGISFGLSINGAAPTPPYIIYSLRDTRSGAPFIIPLNAGDSLTVINTNTALNDPFVFISGPGYNNLNHPGWGPTDAPAATFTIIQIA